ncbi:MAG TPA: hypothetical protein PLU38_07120, partial [Kiritimatiellia bacterium]|nr:hypothetical protein [Kiritimatiellia bacterium]
PAAVGGSFAMTVAGNLAGSGKITATDGGWVTFAGADNSYSGLLDIPSGRNLRIGNGANFSWSPAGTFAVNGTLALNYNSDWALSYPFSGAGSLRKEGGRRTHALRTEQLRRHHLHRRRHAARDRNQCPAQRSRERRGDDRCRRDAGDRWA